MNDMKHNRIYFQRIFYNVYLYNEFDLDEWNLLKNINVSV